MDRQVPCQCPCIAKALPFVRQGFFKFLENIILVYITSKGIPFISRNLGNCLSQIRSALLSGTKVA